MRQCRMDDEFARLQALDRFMDQLVARIEKRDIVRHGDLLAEPGARDDTRIDAFGLGACQALPVKCEGFGGDERAVARHQIEHRLERRKGAAGDRGAGLFQPLDRILEGFDDFVFRLVEDDGFGDDDREAGDRAAANHRCGQSMHGGVEPDRILHRMTERPERIEAFGEREDALHRIAAARRFVADDAGHGRRDSDGAASIGTDCRGHETGRDRRRRARRGAAGDALDIGRGRVVRRAVMRIDAEAGEGELAHVGSPDADHAGTGNRADHGGVTASRRGVPQDRGTRGRHAALDVEEILPGDRKTIEQAERSARTKPGGGRRGLLKRAFAGDADKDRLIAVRRDAGKCLLCKRDRVELAFLDEYRKPGERFLSGHGLPLSACRQRQLVLPLARVGRLLI